jgi:hypothetical protein
MTDAHPDEQTMSESLSGSLNAEETEALWSLLALSRGRWCFRKNVQIVPCAPASRAGFECLYVPLCVAECFVLALSVNR